MASPIPMCRDASDAKSSSHSFLAIWLSVLFSYNPSPNYFIIINYFLAQWNQTLLQLPPSWLKVKVSCVWVPVRRQFYKFVSASSSRWDHICFGHSSKKQNTWLLLISKRLGCFPSKLKWERQLLIWNQGTLPWTSSQSLAWPLS